MSLIIKNVIDFFKVKNFLIQRSIACAFTIMSSFILGHASSFSNCMDETDSSGEYTKNFESVKKNESHSNNPPIRPSENAPPQPSITTKNSPSFSDGKTHKYWLHPDSEGDFQKQKAINTQTSFASHAQQESVWSNFETNCSKVFCCDRPNAGEPLLSFSFDFFNFSSTPDVISIASVKQAHDNIITNPMHEARVSIPSDNLAIIAQGDSGCQSGSSIVSTSSSDGGGWQTILKTKYKGGPDSYSTTAPSASKYLDSLGAEDVSAFLDVFANPFEPLKESDGLDAKQSLESQEAFDKFLQTMASSTSDGDGRIQLAVKEYFKPFEECAASESLDERLRGSITINDFVYYFPLSSEEEQHVTKIIRAAVETHKKETSLIKNWVIAEAPSYRRVTLADTGRICDLCSDYPQLKIILPVSQQTERSLLLFLSSSFLVGIPTFLVFTFGGGPPYVIGVFLAMTTTGFAGLKDVAVDAITQPVEKDS